MCYAASDLQAINPAGKSTSQLARERNAVDVNLGSGLAQRAKLSIMSRQQRIDSAVNAQSK